MFRETKYDLALSKRRRAENTKIKCAEARFGLLTDMGFTVVNNMRQV